MNENNDSIVARTALKIKQLRQLHHYTQEEVAKQLGFTKSAYSKIERGLTIPTVVLLQKLADIFDEHIVYFFLDEEPKTRKDKETETQKQRVEALEKEVKRQEKEFKGSLKMHTRASEKLYIMQQESDRRFATQQEAMNKLQTRLQALESRLHPQTSKT
jgi:transcriptional regulator with XRE-family HTH domain